MASLVEGWVLEMDEKCVKYRGDVWDVAKVLECALGYFIKVGDRYK